MVLVKEKTNRSMKQNKEPGHRPTQIQSTTFDKGAMAIQWKTRIFFLANTIETIGHPYAKINLDIDLILWHKLTQNES